MTEIRPEVPDDPYGEMIAAFLRADFPLASASPAATLESLTRVFTMTQHMRIGPAPSPETLVTIRDVLAHRIARQEPVPMLAPWGSRKPDLTSLDVADVSALKMLRRFSDQVRAVYPPGVRLTLRLEDSGGHWLYRDSQGVVGDAASLRYLDDLEALIRVAGLHVSSPAGFVLPVRETNIVGDESKFFAETTYILPLMLDYLRYTDLYGDDAVSRVGGRERLAKLQELGWRGRVPAAQREHYRERYRRLYPGLGEERYTTMLAEYLTGSFAKHRLRMTAVDPAWQGKFVHLSFVPPVPGTPPEMEARRIYMRAADARDTHVNVAPWRARGYLRVTDDSVAVKFATPRTLPADLVPLCVLFEDGNESVTVNANYALGASK